MQRIMGKNLGLLTAVLLLWANTMDTGTKVYKVSSRVSVDLKFRNSPEFAFTLCEDWLPAGKALNFWSPHVCLKFILVPFSHNQWHWIVVIHSSANIYRALLLVRNCSRNCFGSESTLYKANVLMRQVGCGKGRDRKEENKYLICWAVASAGEKCNSERIIRNEEL